jgi:hypothetical protein
MLYLKSFTSNLDKILRSASIYKYFIVILDILKNKNIIIYNL